VIRNRRAALDGLSKIMDAAAPEDLFTGSEDEALFLYELLGETIKGRSSSYYWEICRTARRRGVTPEYVVDRASVLQGAMLERRRTDLYRILSVPPLASDEMIRLRWLEVAKRHHPDVGGDADTFRHAKQAYEVLRDATRRAEYERFWLRALGPFERVMPHDEAPLLEAMAASVRVEARVAAGHPVVALRPRPVAVRPAEPPREPAAEGVRGTLHAAARLLAEREVLDRRIVTSFDGGVGTLLARVEAAMASVRREEIDALHDAVTTMIRDLEAMRAGLESVVVLKARLGA
jgi:hypothetical protein